MSRPNKPWFRKSNKRWYVWFDGKQVNLGPDKKAAHQQFHQLMALPTPSVKVPRSGHISLAELADNFLEWVQRNRAPDTYEWYRYRLERLCKLHGTVNAQQLRPYQVEEWVSSYVLSVTSRRNYFRSAKRCFKWGKKQGYIDTNPIADLEVPRAEQKEVALSQSEFDDLMTNVRNPNLATLMRVTWLTGCRPQESLIVEARHVDTENQRWVFHTSQSKGKKITRVVYLCDAAMEIVKGLMHQHPTGRLFRTTTGNNWNKDSVGCAFGAVQFRMGKEEMGKQGIVISDEEIAKFVPQLSPTKKSGGNEIEKSAAMLRCEAKRKLTQKLVRELVPRYSLYALRHSFATNALRKGIDSLTVAVLLGHQDPSTLARVYQHLNQNPAHLLEQARKAAA